ncbi:MAG: acetylxylan esterase [Eubacteriales bacterium]
MKEIISDQFNLQEWDLRKKTIRSFIAKKTGIDFSKTAEAINCIETNVTDMGSYFVKNVYWQTLHNYYVAGNIYLPKEIDDKIPAVMMPHGHFKNDRFYDDNNQLAPALAKLGCMAVTYDMVGKGEDTETPHDNKYNNALQLHNSIRILDYISTLEYIDKERIAVTGASGGGTQTMMLSAIDSRINVSIPVCMLSVHFHGGCLCEMGMNYFEGKSFETTTAEIAAMFAPKDMLVISIGTDWTKNTPNVEFPYLQKIYGLYNAEGRVKNAHFKKEEHNYGPSKRAAAIQFLSDLFKLDLNKYNESENILLPIEALKSYSNKYPKPADALTKPKAIYEQMLEYYSNQYSTANSEVNK